MEVAADLEGLSDYRPKNAKCTTILLGASKSVTMYEEQRKQYDEDGDVIMGDTNALLSANENLVLNQKDVAAGKGSKPNKDKHKCNSANNSIGKPRAPWLTKKVFSMLIKKGLCFRCKIPGYKAPSCNKFGPPIRIEADLGSLNCEYDDPDEGSGKDKP
ncbi:hypothetical protein GcM3_030033 [Golovinomyces cichoracearum]|uniref:Uncharacterized protein n=1 Tax=Golovinomyces cichoracearum TaxID=62708 RepID=A0A420J560_9PEZI|nr:hypothetical protein GcM3_030033 [Golovinomyces cichoracearum]